MNIRTMTEGECYMARIEWPSLIWRYELQAIAYAIHVNAGKVG